MFNLKTTATVNEKTFNRVAFIVCAVILSLVIFALLTGDIRGFNNTYLSK